MQIASIFLAACVCWPGDSMEKKGNAEMPHANGEQREFSRLAAAAAASYRIRLAELPDQPLELRPEPILKWSNPEHGRIYGEVFIWTAQGRPEAIASIYKWYHPFKHSSHEFQSLSTSGLKISRDASAEWNIEGSGIAFAPLSDVPPPASSTTERLRQMRSAARSFRIDATSRQGDRSGLRLLSAPLYRYDSPAGQMVDGALFAFVQATDPDALLLIEASRVAGGAAEWKFALARLNSIKLQGFYRERQVWEAPELPWHRVQDRSQAYFSLRFEE